MSVRFELRVPEELMAAIDAARGHEKRAAFIKRTLAEALAEPHDVGMSPELRAKLREHWDSPELEAQMVEEPFVVAPGPGLMPPGRTSAERHAKPVLPPGVKTARQLAGERQAKMNAAREKKS